MGFAHLGGPLVQGLEKMKPHYAKMLRSASQGGFAFSARKFLDAGSSDGGRHCHSIMEFDLSLAYGYSALNPLMPSGFCTGFFYLEEGGGGGERRCFEVVICCWLIDQDRHCATASNF